MPDGARRQTDRLPWSNPGHGAWRHRRRAGEPDQHGGRSFPGGHHVHSGGRSQLIEEIGIVQRVLDQASGIDGLDGRLHDRGEVAAEIGKRTVSGRVGDQTRPRGP